MTETIAPRLGWRRPWYGVPLAALLAVLCALLRYGDFAPIEALRLAGFDLFQRVLPRQPQDDQLALIVDIDDESLAALGQWPWPRWRVAALVERILAAEPAALAIDVLFAEPDRLSPERVATEMPGLPTAARELLLTLPSNDERLAQAIAKGPVTLAVAGSDVAGPERADLPGFRTPTRLIGTDPGRALSGFPGRIASQHAIRMAARGEGVVNVPPERDNIVRRVPAVLRIDTHLVPLLTVDALRLAAGAGALGVVAGDAGVDAVRLGDFELRTLPDGRVWPRLTPHRPERFVSALAVFHAAEALPALTGRVVILGSTATALGDFHATAIAPRMAGPEIQAQVIEAALDGELLRRPRRDHLVEAAIVATFAVLIALALPYRRPVLAAVLLAGAASLLFAASFASFAGLRLLVDGLTPAAAGFVVFGQMLAAQLVTTDRERRHMAAALQRQRVLAARHDGELAAARQIQMGMLPQSFPVRPEIEIHARLEPAKAVGGDFYDVAELPDGRIYFAVGDVSGKGVPAALFMALAKALARAGARRAVPIDVMVTSANAELAAENPAMMFVTLLAGVIDPVTGQAVLVSAGHDAPLRLFPGREPLAIEDVGGPPLCADDGFAYPSVTVQLERGETLMIVTDGIADACSTTEEFYGGERLLRVARGLGGLPVQAAVDAVFRDVHRFAAGAEPHDDISVLAIRWLGPPSAR